jgi:hypothetical protein
MRNFVITPVIMNRRNYVTTLSATYKHMLPWTIGSLFLLLSRKVNLCRTSAIATCAQFKGTVARDVFLIILSYL